MNRPLGIFHKFPSYFTLQEKVFFAKHSSLSSLQTDRCVFILNNLHRFGIYDRVDSSKNYDFQTRSLPSLFFTAFLISWLDVALNVT